MPRYWHHTDENALGFQASCEGLGSRTSPERTFSGGFWKTGKVHPGRLTLNRIIEVWKIIFLSKWEICMFHGNLPGCAFRNVEDSSASFMSNFTNTQEMLRCQGMDENQNQAGWIQFHFWIGGWNVDELHFAHGVHTPRPSSRYGHCVGGGACPTTLLHVFFFWYM